MIFEATGPFNAIGKIAMAEVEAALSAGWRVSVVAHRLCKSLQGRVEWLKLYNPPRGFALKWLTARHFIKKAMCDPSRFDVIHGHQPQIADFCDVFECHYLTRAAMERGCVDAREGLRGMMARVQETIVLWAEDRCYSRWNPQAELLCNSKLTRNEFSRLYGLPPIHEVQTLPAPTWHPPNDTERHEARLAFAGTWDGPVVGFLGGINERKGYRDALDAVAASERLFLLFGGSHSEQVVPPADMSKRFRGLGLISDVDRFYAAIDVLLVPSVFEPFGLVCFEAASRGVPVITTKTVGALSALEPHGAAVRWSPGTALEPVVQELIGCREQVTASCRRAVEASGHEMFAKNLLKRYEAALERKRAHSGAVAAGVAVG
ncbi:MAG: glycosyltransferase family 4 protein [Rhodospirillales bacterium]|nr:glycosyltransferase family 4 protein [Rhodospirillales bacterium]